MKREEKEISPYLLPTGYVMESCPEPWKCQERKGRSEGEKEDGQQKKEEEKRDGEKGRENVRICPLEDMKNLQRYPDQKVGGVFMPESYRPS